MADDVVRDYGVRGRMGNPNAFINRRRDLEGFLQSIKPVEEEIPTDAFGAQVLQNPDIEEPQTTTPEPETPTEQPETQTVEPVVEDVIEETPKEEEPVVAPVPGVSMSLNENDTADRLSNVSLASDFDNWTELLYQLDEMGLNGLQNRVPRSTPEAPEEEPLVAPVTESYLDVQPQMGENNPNFFDLVMNLGVTPAYAEVDESANPTGTQSERIQSAVRRDESAAPITPTSTNELLRASGELVTPKEYIPVASAPLTVADILSGSKDFAELGWNTFLDTIRDPQGTLDDARRIWNSEYNPINLVNEGFNGLLHNPEELANAGKILSLPLNPGVPSYTGDPTVDLLISQSYREPSEEDADAEALRNSAWAEQWKNFNSEFQDPENFDQLINEALNPSNALSDLRERGLENVEAPLRALNPSYTRPEQPQAPFSNTVGDYRTFLHTLGGVHFGDEDAWNYPGMPNYSWVPIEQAIAEDQAIAQGEKEWENLFASIPHDNAVRDKADEIIRALYPNISKSQLTPEQWQNAYAEATRIISAREAPETTDTESGTGSEGAKYPDLYSMYLYEGENALGLSGDALIDYATRMANSPRLLDGAAEPSLTQEEYDALVSGSDNPRTYDPATMQPSESTGNLATMVALQKGETTYEQIWKDAYNKAIRHGLAEDAAKRAAYNRIIELGYIGSDGWTESEIFDMPFLEDMMGIESAIDNNYWTNEAGALDRWAAMVMGGNDLRNDRAFDQLAYLNPPAMGADGKWNEAGNILLSGDLSTEEILHAFDRGKGFADSANSGVTILPEFADVIAQSANSAQQQKYLNNGKNADRMETVSMTADEFQKKYDAFLEANPILKQLRDSGRLTDTDIVNHFFKGVKLTTGKKAGTGSGSGYRGYGGGGYGGYGGYRGGYNYQAPPTETKQEEQRINNIMKNWSF